MERRSKEMTLKWWSFYYLLQAQWKKAVVITEADGLWPAFPKAHGLRALHTLCYLIFTTALERRVYNSGFSGEATVTQRSYLLGSASKGQSGFEPSTSGDPAIKSPPATHMSRVEE